MQGDVVQVSLTVEEKQAAAILRNVFCDDTIR